METNLIAAFSKKTDLEHAIAELKQQGVLDLRYPNLREDVELAEDITYSLDVLVEKSRWRHAEDTIIRHGGQLNIVPADPEAPDIRQASHIAPQ